MNGTSGRKIDEDRTRSDVREQQQRKDKRKDDKEVMTDKKKREGDGEKGILWIWNGNEEFDKLGNALIRFVSA